ncbi:hypothetical protein SK355_06480 [Candidatus Fukatsuia symbiotica]|uniref:Lysine-N-methylase n=1 Tax=Candidatus Fukatsuia symbiotica TaxID=1878942 RepID=A0A2U8I644_9GAMM|nr:hypothetical protein [Candidatus Fukatsuia symbiotica]AWK14612.1 hypothetical protein CCS41_09225 [Candidatus Fukatsuia symbiotica]MEA9444923.1 hypothetical protein [Candidatus Fukatsuia symbiotica]
MSNIQCYQPEYVNCFADLETSCECPFCATENELDTSITFNWQNEERQSLFLGCETACREILLNPQALTIYAVNKQSETNIECKIEGQELNYLIFNLVTNENFSLEQSLYVASILLNRAEQEQEAENQEEVLERIKILADEFNLLSEQGSLQQTFCELPEIENVKSSVLALLGMVPLSLTLPIAQKIPFILKLSELSLMQKIHLDERKTELMTIWQEQLAPYFDKHPHILQNYVLYQVYHNTFPYHDSLNYGQMFRLLSIDLFNIKILCSIWKLNNDTLDETIIVKMVSAYSRWRMDKNFDFTPMLKKIHLDSGEDLLIGISLLK